MKILVVPDSFKGSLSSVAAALAMEQGIRRANPSVEVINIPMADGGEGTLDAILSALGGKRVSAVVQAPLAGQVEAEYGLLSDGTAIIEMAKAAGLSLVAPEAQDPRLTTTYGVGQLLMAAADSGAKKIIVGLGGSCTNDGGAGAMQALGVRFLDSYGESIGDPVCGVDLIRLNQLDLSKFRFPIGRIEVIAASDVTNPLTGPNGASAIYGPQKGATEDAVEELDAALSNFARVVHKQLGVDIAQKPGSGAAGGLGGALIAFLNAKKISGIDLLLDLASFEEKAASVDWVFTGEGQIDMQTVEGKVVAGLLRRCNKIGVPVIAFAGAVDPMAENILSELGIAATVPIVNRCMPLIEAVKCAPQLLEQAAYRTTRLLETCAR